MAANLILWVSLIWLPWLVYFMLKNESKPKKNIIVGVTLPFEGQDDPEVKALLARFQKELFWTAVLLTLVAVPGFFLPGLGLCMTVWMIWMVAACFVPNIPYIRCNRALRELKERRGWKRLGSARPAADLSAAAAELKWLSPLWFLPPLLISLIPLPFDRELWFLWLIMAAMVVLCYCAYRFCCRSRAEMVDGDTGRTVALTRIRRYYWGKSWLIMAWALGILNPLLWLTLDHIWWSMAVLLVYSVLAVWVMLRIEFRVRALQEKLTAGSGQGFYVDEDELWIWGMLYCNPNDTRLIINARVGMNTTVNLARPAGKVLAGLLVLLMAALPLFGVWIMDMEKAEVELCLTAEELQARHYHREYTLALEEVADVRLVEQLPEMKRVAGTGLPTACTGKWSAEEWGRFQCCVDPRVGPWLLVEAEDGEFYLFGGGEESSVSQVFTRLTEQNRN